MTFEQPYKFKGGTSAKAQEVNANFDYVGDYLEGIETVQVGLEGEINDLDQTKANLHGSEQNVFNVAPATSTNNAVPLGQLNDFLYIIKNIARGLNVITYPGSFDVTLTSGACFDSTENYLIKNLSSLSKTYTMVTTGEVVNVWIVADKNNPTETSLELGTGGSPSIGTNNIFRQIAYITTNETGFDYVTYTVGRVS